MDKLLTVLFLALSILFCSCDEKQEPVVKKSYKIARIEGDVDNYFESFEYNDKGLISRWEEHYYEGSEKSGVAATYEYNDDNSVIFISAEEVFADFQRREFSDTLYLDERGIADRAKGLAVIYRYGKDGDYIYAQGYYKACFKYDSLDQLTLVDHSENRTPFLNWEGQGIFNGYYELEWKDGNMYESKYYSYYDSSKRAESKTTYSYYGGNLVDYNPVLQYAILRSFYIPLQYTGMFGKRSKDLIKEKTYTSYNSYEEGAPFSRTLAYSYDLSTTMYDSWVEGYNLVDQTTGKEYKYKVSWEAE